MLHWFGAREYLARGSRRPCVLFGAAKLQRRVRHRTTPASWRACCLCKYPLVCKYRAASSEQRVSHPALAANVRYGWLAVGWLCCCRCGGRYARRAASLLELEAAPLLEAALVVALLRRFLCTRTSTRARSCSSARAVSRAEGASGEGDDRGIPTWTTGTLTTIRDLEAKLSVRSVSLNQL